MNQLVRGAVALSLVSAATLGAQAAAPRDTIITAPTRAPRTPLPSEAASAKIKKFSFIAYGDTRGRFDGTALQVEHGKVVESMLGTIKQVAGTGDAMRRAGYEARNLKQMAADPKMAEEFKGYRMIVPQVEYQGKMTLAVGERVVELLQVKNVHSEADTAIWLPKERVLFATAAVGVKRFPNIRPFLNIADILASIKIMRDLKPEVVIAGHGEPGTTAIFDEMERYYALLLERVGKLAGEGKSIEQVKAELRMPEYDDWAAKERFPNNVEAAYRAVAKR